MSAPEFSRLFDRRYLPGEAVSLSASPAECAALATRFALRAIHRLEAKVTLVPEGAAVLANGRLRAQVVQACAVSGEDLPQAVDEPVALRFVPEGTPATPGEEIEISAEECDEIAYAGAQFDLGEALAQSLVLALDPFATGPGAEAARRAAGLLDEQAGGAFAALAALKPKN
jgi:uncharacterized metal-binding protein YceD (DUF177 family)